MQILLSVKHSEVFRIEMKEADGLFLFQKGLKSEQAYFKKLISGKCIHVQA